MREILFRGIDKFGIWHWGCLHIDTLKKEDKFYINSRISINNPEFIEVIKESVGQYTGIKDKNLNYIYEGDIVLIGKHYYSVKYEIGSFMLVRCNVEVDMYEQFENCWNDDVYPLCQLYWENDSEEDCIYELEVVGNIFENSNLLEQ